MTKTKKQALIELQAFLKAFGVLTESDVAWSQIGDTAKIVVRGLSLVEIVAVYHALHQAIYCVPWLSNSGNLGITILGEGKL